MTKDQQEFLATMLKVDRRLIRTPEEDTIFQSVLASICASFVYADDKFDVDQFKEKVYSE